MKLNFLVTYHVTSEQQFSCSHNLQKNMFLGRGWGVKGWGRGSWFIEEGLKSVFRTWLRYHFTSIHFLTICSPGSDYFFSWIWTCHLPARTTSGTAVYILLCISISSYTNLLNIEKSLNISIRALILQVHYPTPNTTYSAIWMMKKIYCTNSL